MVILKKPHKSKHGLEMAKTTGKQQNTKTNQ